MSNLCQFCLDLLLETTDGRGELNFRHYSTVGDLLKSVTSCSLCRALAGRMHFRNPIPPRADLNTSFALTLVKVYIYTSGLFIITCRFHIGSDPPEQLSIKCPRVGSEAFEAPLWRKSTCTFESKVRIIRKWLDDCLLHHSECRESVTFGLLPARLVAISQKGENLRLFHTSTSSKDISYATLSYCWGPPGSRTFALTKENFETLGEEGFPQSSLPRTLSEAVDLTRALGIDYIWIDSLCIVQDDELDWQQQSATMHSIYQLGTISIQAGDAQHCDEGLYIPNPNQLPLDDTTGISTEGCVFVRCSQSFLSAGDSFFFNHLSKRGWTFQEQLLARRRVTFTDGELCWTCACMQRSDSGGMDDHELLPGFSDWSFGIPRAKLNTSPDTWWQEMMYRYSCRKFTYGSDWMPALAGAVHAFKAKKRSEPLLTCWEESFFSDMSWMATVTGKGEEAIPNVPSWSWISRCGAVIFPDAWAFDWGHSLYTKGRTQKVEHSRPYGKLLEHSVRWSGVPYVTQLLSTKIVLEGPVKQLTLNAQPLAKVNHAPASAACRREFEIDLESNTEKSWECIGRFDIGPRDGDDPHTLEATSYTCLHTMDVRIQSWGGYECLYELLVILSQELRDGTEVYKRVGLIAIISGGDYESVFGEGEMKRLELI